MNTEETEHGVLDTWTPQEVADAYANGKIVLVDVRTPAEFMFEHVEGAMLAPMSFFKAENLPENDAKPVVFYCGSGARSRRVAMMALESGFDRIAQMEGGFGGWKSAGLPHVATNMATGAPQIVTPKGS
ncbi:rhodanese-like domain-containing protein [Oricola cellulosilytica]|uniref:Rhodanese-like domain-containing protein n=1 Tax=Oricola cellulosilytica TaxID=1429082 RepID=A0A4V2MP71_9HYPH|nr:rhodanese-like domain-containing protein [Oricola cellulosilytica]TCD16602.1 rhodanese-like domain-containing protein [Oricola cellulosilytica]